MSLVSWKILLWWDATAYHLGSTVQSLRADILLCAVCCSAYAPLHSTSSSSENGWFMILQWHMQFSIFYWDSIHCELHVHTYFSSLFILFQFSVIWLLSNIQSGRERFTFLELHFWTGGFILGKRWLLCLWLLLGFPSWVFVPELGPFWKYISLSIDRGWCYFYLLYYFFFDFNVFFFFFHLAEIMLGFFSFSSVCMKYSSNFYSGLFESLKLSTPGCSFTCALDLYKPTPLLEGAVIFISQLFFPHTFASPFLMLSQAWT